jgi:hypothetical protein
MREPIRHKDELDLMLDTALATYADPGRDSGLEERVLAALGTAAMAGTRGTVRGDRKRLWWLRRWFVWAMAIPVTACVLLWVGVPRFRHIPGHEEQNARMRAPDGPDAAQGAKTIHAVPPSGLETLTGRAAATARLNPRPVTKRGTSLQAEQSCAETDSASRHFSAPMRSACREQQPDASEPTEAANRAALPKLDVFPTPQPLTAQEHALLKYAQQAPPAKVEALSEVQAEDEDAFRVASVHLPAFEPPIQGTN